MSEVIRETVTTQENSVKPVVVPQTIKVATNSQTIEYVIYFLFGILGVLLAFRMILKLTGASTASGFVSAIYGVTRIFILPFEGIFRRGIAQAAGTTSVFEPATLVAIIVYALLGWGIVKLVRISSGEKQEA